MPHNPDTVGCRQIHVYQIKIAGHLGPRWEPWFEGLEIALNEEGQTLLTGPVADQSALYGLLKRIHDLGMSLLSVNRVQPGQADAAKEQTKS